MKYFKCFILQIFLLINILINFVFTKTTSKLSSDNKNSLKNKDINLLKSKETSEEISNFTIIEMDELLACSLITQRMHNKYQNEINNLTIIKENKTNIKMFNEKLGAEIFKICMKKIDVDIAEMFFKNLTVINHLKNEIPNFIEINLEKFNSEYALTHSLNLEFTNEEIILSKKFREVKKIFLKKQKELRKETIQNNSDVRIIGIKLNQLPEIIQRIILIIIFLIFFFGLTFLLKHVIFVVGDTEHNQKIN